MLVHRRVTPSIEFSGTYLYTWVKSQRHNDKIASDFLAQEHNAVTPARFRTRTTASNTKMHNERVRPTVTNLIHRPQTMLQVALPWKPKLCYISNLHYRFKHKTFLLKNRCVLYYNQGEESRHFSLTNRGAWKRCKSVLIKPLPRKTSPKVCFSQKDLNINDCIRVKCE